MTRRRVADSLSTGLRKSDDANAVVNQGYSVSNIEGVTHYLYSVAGTTRAQEWILDSGASTQITRDEKLLSDCQPMKAVHVVTDLLLLQ
jgi:hypothetical protein